MRKVPHLTGWQIAKIFGLSLLGLLVAPFAGVVRFFKEGGPWSLVDFLLSILLSPGLTLLWFFDVYGGDDVVNQDNNLSEGATTLLLATSTAYWIWLAT